MHGLLATPCYKNPFTRASLLRFILWYKTAIRHHKPHNLRYQRLKMLYGEQTRQYNNIKAHFVIEKPVQWKKAQLTSVNDGQGRGRNIARVVLIQCGRRVFLSREVLESSLGVIWTPREFHENADVHLSTSLLGFICVQHFTDFKQALISGHRRLHQRLYCCLTSSEYFFGVCFFCSLELANYR